jgi:hypothetical protein
MKVQQSTLDALPAVGAFDEVPAAMAALPPEGHQLTREERLAILRAKRRRAEKLLGRRLRRGEARRMALRGRELALVVYNRKTTDPGRRRVAVIERPISRQPAPLTPALPPVLGAQREGHGRPRQANAPPTKEDDPSGDADPIASPRRPGDLLPAGVYVERLLGRLLEEAA